MLAAVTAAALGALIVVLVVAPAASIVAASVCGSVVLVARAVHGAHWYWRKDR